MVEQRPSGVELAGGDQRQSIREQQAWFVRLGFEGAAVARERIFDASPHGIRHGEVAVGIRALRREGESGLEKGNGLTGSVGVAQDGAVVDEDVAFLRSKLVR